MYLFFQKLTVVLVSTEIPSIMCDLTTYPGLYHLELCMEFEQFGTCCVFENVGLSNTYARTHTHTHTRTHKTKEKRAEPLLLCANHWTEL